MIRGVLALLFFFTLQSCTEFNQSTSNTIPNPPIQIKNDTININDRTSWQKPNSIINKLGILSDKTVADIGAGTGYFAFRLIHRAEKIIAIDIDTTMINLIEAFKSTMSTSLSSKIETRLAPSDDPMLANNEVDIVLLSNVIPYLENRIEYLGNLIPSLRIGGKIVIVDFKTKRLPIHAPDYSDRVLMHVIEEELYEAGYSYVEIDDTTLDFQYIIVATP